MTWEGRPRRLRGTAGGTHRNDTRARKRAQGKRHNAALICLARRRVDVIYAMLRDRKPYQIPTLIEPDTTPAAA